MGFHENPKEILAGSYHYNAAFIGRSDSAVAGFSCGPLYLYPVLTRIVHRAVRQLLLNRKEVCLQIKMENLWV